MLATQYEGKHFALHATSVTRLFEQQAALRPQATALRAGTHILTYEQLNFQANQFAHYLRSMDIGEGAVVGVCVERGVPMVVALLGILKAGAAYLPLDPQFPPERLHYMVDDAAVALLLCEANTDLDVGDASIFDMNNDWPVVSDCSGSNLDTAASAADLAYIIYTSGSTGKPKGVRVGHGNVINFLGSMAEAPGISEDDCLLAITTISFDIHVLELFLPLVNGASIRLADRRTAMDGYRLREELEHPAITMMQATPTTWRMAIAAGWCGKNNFTALIGGEAFPADLVEPLFNRCDAVWNMYGPTETTVWSTCYRLANATAKPLVGKPIANTQLYVVKEDGELAGAGEEGELYIGGAGVAQGYHKREALTRERFVPNAVVPGATDLIYKTGDLARLCADGNLEYLGRLDDQIKFHGYRIELGDIEASLIAFTGITQAVVVAAGSDVAQMQLVAFYGAQDEVDAHALRQHCAMKLPPYMVPQAFVWQQQFPLTPNNKVDRRKLAQIWLETRDTEEQITPLPQDDFERALLVVWQKVLGHRAISLTDSFVDVGGDSISAFSLIQEMEQATGVRFPMEKMLENPSIRDLVAYTRTSNTALPISVVPLQGRGHKLPVFCLCGVNLYQDLASHIGADRPTYGIYSPVEIGHMNDALAGLVPKVSVEALARRYCDAIVRNYPQGPYFLTGFSFGGVVAVETARLLQALNKEVAAVVLLDSLLPHAKHNTGLDSLRVWLRAIPALLTDMGKMLCAKALQREHSAQRLLHNKAAALRNRAYHEAGMAYAKAGKRYAGKVVLVKGSHSEIVADQKVRTDYGWSDVLLDEPEVYEVSGKHADIIKGAGAEITAQICRRYLPDA